MDTNRDTIGETTEKTAPDEEREAAFEDLVDELGAEPPHQLSPDEVQPVEVTPDVLPDARPDQLGDQQEAEGLPGNEHPTSSEPSDLGVGAAVVDGQVDFTDVDPADLGVDGADPFLTDDFDELIDADQGTGGLDGRNPASDGGSGNPNDSLPGETDPSGPFATPEFERSGLGNPYGGAGFIDGSAAGALPAHQQEVLHDLQAKSQAALDAGDHAGVDTANKETEEFLKEIGEFNTPKEGGEKPPTETFRSGGAEVGNDPSEGVQATEAQEKMADKVEAEGGAPKVLSDLIQGKTTVAKDKDGKLTVEKSERQKALDAAEKDIEESSTPQDSSKDFGEGAGLNGPDVHRDFTDEFFDSQSEADAGADIDPNPNDDVGFSSTDDVSTDTDPFTAEYDEAYLPPDDSVAEDRAQAFDITPDEEFLDS